MQNYKLNKVNTAVKSALMVGILAVPTTVLAQDEASKKAGTEEIETIQVIHYTKQTFVKEIS